jgi:predicted DNA-binding transcriptional regulator AlpA
VSTLTPSRLSSQERKGQALGPALLTAEQAAREVYGTSERTFHKMREAGLVPPAVVLGPRLLRWVRSELEAAVQAMPRQQQPASEPPQLLRSKIERLKRTAQAAGSTTSATA